MFAHRVRTIACPPALRGRLTAGIAALPPAGVDFSSLAGPDPAAFDAGAGFGPWGLLAFGGAMLLAAGVFIGRRTGRRLVGGAATADADQAADEQVQDRWTPQLADATGLGIVFLSADGRVQWANRAGGQLIDQSPDALTGRSFAAVLDTLNAESTTDVPIETLLATSTPVSTTVRFRPPSGLTRHVRLDLRPAEPSGTSVGPVDLASGDAGSEANSSVNPGLNLASDSASSPASSPASDPASDSAASPVSDLASSPASDAVSRQVANIVDPGEHRVESVHNALVIVLTDVTDQALEQAELDARLHEMQTIVDAVPSLIYYKDDRNNVMFSNRAGAEAVGRTTEEMVGASVEEVWPEHAAKYLADDLEVLAADTAKLDIIEGFVATDGMNWMSTDKIPVDDPRTGERRILVVVTFIDDRMAMQAELERQPKQLQAIIDAVPASIMVKDADGRIIQGNAAFARSMGRPIEEIQGQFLTDVSPEVSSALRESQPDGLQPGAPQLGAAETQAVGDGSKTLLADTVPIQGPDGEPHVLVITNDVTDLEEARRQLDFALDAGELGLWDWSVPSGELWLNEHWFAMLGRRVEPGPKTIDAMTQWVHADDRPSFDAAIARALAGPEDRFEIEMRMRSIDGSWTWVVNRGMVVSRDESGRGERIVGMHIDIDRQKFDQIRLDVAMDSGQLGLWEWRCDQPELELAPSSRELLGVEGQQSLDGVGVMELIHPEDLAATMHAVGLILGGVQPGFEIEHRVRTRSGRWVWMRSIGRVVSRHPDGRPDRLVGFLVDIDLIKRSETRLAQALEAAEAGDRAKHAFLTSMSHELRTPITSMLGHAELLEEGDISAAERFEHVASIRRQGDRLIDLVDGLMDVSRAAADEFMVEVTEVDLAAVFRDIAELFCESALAAQRPLTFSCLGPVSMVVETDETRLRQVIMQLISNALSHADSGPVRIQLRERREASGVSNLAILVSDEGGGIPAELIERLADPFEQVDSSMSRRVTGAGVGLTLVHGICHRLDGDIRISSAEGFGTTVAARLRVGAAASSQSSTAVLDAANDCFKAAAAAAAVQRPDAAPAISPGTRPVELDVSSDDQSARTGSRSAAGSTERPAAGSTDGPAGGPTDGPAVGPAGGGGGGPASGPASALQGRRVLVAEDGPDNQRLILFHLRKAGASVEIAGNGSLAVQAAERARREGIPFDVVVMDIQMPEMCGVEATETLRSRGFEMPIIAFTAHAVDGERERCMAAGFNEFETKPFIRDRLIARLEAVLDPDPEVRPGDQAAA